MTEPLLLRLPTGPLDVNCYIIACPVTRETIIVDPGGDGEEIKNLLDANHLIPVVIVNSHGHFDHIGGNACLLSSYEGLKLCIHGDDLTYLKAAGEHAEYWGMPFEDSPLPTCLLTDGDEVRAGDLKLRVIHTPGHSPGGISLYIPGHVFTGDALFSGSIGRTDLPGGDYRRLISSIMDRILTLPDSTAVHPGHGPETTVGEEKAGNPFLQ
ncbi:MAG: MBL fold metallo-hydrolase [Candidatus Fermentibacteraceae bacterium]|nr:MBL fold metallo-hydrolase [Candidatus Fermentibacteraceae bacterium]MBN2609457.1 MBL fold metallo-hydrolase [Candidatus Fermentibacteraceae bacterium]